MYAGISMASDEALAFEQDNASPMKNGSGKTSGLLLEFPLWVLDRPSVDRTLAMKIIVADERETR